MRGGRSHCGQNLVVLVFFNQGFFFVGGVVVWEFFLVGILLFLSSEMGILHSPVLDLC